MKYWYLAVSHEQSTSKELVALLGYWSESIRKNGLQHSLWEYGSRGKLDADKAAAVAKQIPGVVSVEVYVD